MAKLIRLNAILELVDSCDTLIDVGCDHGLFSKMTLDKGLAKKVIACDISEASLSKAKNLLKNYSNIEFLQCDGKELAIKATDTVVISGLGGREVINIIANTKAKTLILQPQNYCSFLRRELNNMGYKIIADKVIAEGGKFYDCIKAVEGKEKLFEIQYLWGKFCNIYSVDLAKKLDLQYKKISSYAQTYDNIKKLRIIEEVKKWRQ